MASSIHFSLLLLLATITTQCLAQSAAPAPAPSGPINITAIIEKGGQCATFLRLLASTQVATQIDNQVNSSTEGMTVFAPTDNAFQNLKPGTLNGLTSQQQVQVVLNHVLPKFYTMDDFVTISNPVRTQASGQDGGSFGLNITSTGNNQMNVSSGPVVARVDNTLRGKFPLAVYVVDKVLLPEFGVAKAESPVEAPAKGKGKGSKAEGPASDAASDDEDGKKNGGFGVRSSVGGVMGIALITMGFLF